MPTLNWIGKDKVINHHLDVPYKTLEHQYSYGDENSENKIIHGDNLEALKSLLPEYEGKVKCIYIDPPYNTGNEGWVYNDNVNHPKINKWLGQVVGKESEDLTRHDKWLCMMYPRLKLLHKLLADDGAIFISIDDNEQTYLKLICDEIFGIGNYIGNLIWRKKEGGGQTDKYYVTEHEYISVYQKSNSFLWIDKEKEVVDKGFNKSDNKGKFKLVKLEKWGSSARREDRPTMYFPIVDPENNEYFPIAPDGNEGRWRVGNKRMINLLQNDLVHWEKQNEKFIPYEKIYFDENKKSKIKERSILLDKGNTADASKMITEIFGIKDTFETPKPFQLIEFIIEHSTDKSSIILDSFSGSGTTAHAVLNLNKQDGGNRKFILVEMEDYAETITAERVRRVIDGYSDKEGTGGGFSFYELGQQLFDENHNLNEDVEVEKIREYVWYSEAKENYQKREEAYLLGVKNDSAYYFYYEKGQITTLDESFLRTLKTKASQYIIYADVCLLDEKLMDKYHIVFKKIPRDISKL